MKRQLDAELRPIIEDLKDRNGLKRYMDNMNPEGYPDFISYFCSLDKVNALSRAVLYKQAEIERTYFYHLMSGRKVPGRDKILLLCLAAGLSLLETQVALESGKAALLSVAYKRDIIIAYALENRLGVKETNDLLQEFNEDQLS